MQNKDAYFSYNTTLEVSTNTSEYTGTISAPNYLAPSSISSHTTYNVPVVNQSNNPLPAYAHEYDAGCDGRASLGEDEEVIINPGDNAIIPIGIAATAPIGTFIMLVPRSGLAAKKKVTLSNSIGIVDVGYSNTIGAIIQNNGTEPFVVKNGDRICQLILMPYFKINWKEVDVLPNTDNRGKTGFGDSGIK